MYIVFIGASRKNKQAHLQEAAVDAVDLLAIVPRHIHKIIANKNCFPTECIKGGGEKKQRRRRVREKVLARTRQKPSERTKKKERKNTAKKPTSEK